MPAAEVIPVQMTYVKDAAVEKLVVRFLPKPVGPPLRVSIWMALGSFSEDTSSCGAELGTFTLDILQCLRHALAVNTLAWNTEEGLVAYFFGLCFMGNGY